MKNKIFSLMILSILSMVMLVSCVSAATISEWNFEASTLTPSTGTGALTISDTRTPTYPAGNAPSVVASMSTSGWNTADRYIELDLSTVGYQDITIKFDHEVSGTGPTAFQIQYSSDGTIFTNLGSTTSTAPTFTTNPMNTFNFSSITAIDNNANTEFRIVVPTSGVGSSASGTLHLDNLLIEGSTYVAPAQSEPEEITECALVSNYNDDLEIEIDDIKVISGFGKDNEWLPLDEIEVKIKVDNKHNTEKIKNIEVNWGLYDSNSDDWYIDDKESDFNLKDGDDKTVIITFKLDDNIEDLADYDRLYVWTNDAEINDDNDTPVCASAFEDIDIQTESDFVILDDIQLPSEATCGSNIQLTADIWNIGDSDQEDVWILIKNTELGISEKIMIGDVDAFDKTNLDVLLKIPEDAKESPSYLLTLQVYNEDDDIFENDYDNDEAEFKIPLKVNSCTSSSNPSSITVSASLDSEAKAGEDLIVKATIVNSGTTSSTYTINPTGYTSWANSATTDSSTFTIGSGESKQVTITLGVKDTASGEQTFNIEIVSGGEIVKTQPVAVTIEGKSRFSSITGNLTSGSPLIWGIGFINVILIIVIIIVAVKVARK